MKIILLQDVKKVGRKGEVREVKDGYAMNFLVARGLAAPATAGAMKEIEIVQKEKNAEDEEKKKETLALKEKLSGMTLEIKVKADKHSKMYASLHTKEILLALAGKGIALDETALEIEHPVKALGEYAIGLNLGYGVKGKLKVRLIAEKK